MPLLPSDFIAEMKALLKDDYPEYEKLSEKEPFRGLSVNRLKADPELVQKYLPVVLEKSPFYRDGFYISDNESSLGNDPLHHGGAFYIQEPSAASAVTLLGVEQGDKVLDLCAAPGGKSAQIASCLGGSGLIWSNELVKNRAQILLSNFERMGISKGVVSSCFPETLCVRLEGFFDKVLVDAPCSGEGMFRKNPDAISEWSREHVKACAERQLSILESAAPALRDGGTLVYSTCTFSYEENEGVISRFLERHSEFEPCEVKESFGRPSELKCAVRITPIEGGEGHFAAKLKKRGEPHYSGAAQTKKSCSEDSRILSAKQELSGIFSELPRGEYIISGDKLYIVPRGLPELKGLGVIRAGVLAGEFKKNRFEPAHALFMSSKPDNIKRVLDFGSGDKRVTEFLSGMEIDCECSAGYTAVSYCGVIIGFGKCSSGRLKNKYPKGLRLINS